MRVAIYVVIATLLFLISGTCVGLPPILGLRISVITVALTEHGGISIGMHGVIGLRVTSILTILLTHRGP